MLPAVFSLVGTVQDPYRWRGRRLWHRVTKRPGGLPRMHCCAKARSSSKQAVIMKRFNGLPPRVRLPSKPTFPARQPRAGQYWRLPVCSIVPSGPAVLFEAHRHAEAATTAVPRQYSMSTSHPVHRAGRTGRRLSDQGTIKRISAQDRSIAQNPVQLATLRARQAVCRKRDSSSARARSGRPEPATSIFTPLAGTAWERST
jgi:hypothetical protein